MHGLILLPNMEENFHFQFYPESVTTDTTGVSSAIALPTFVIGWTVFLLFLPVICGVLDGIRVKKVTFS